MASVLFACPACKKRISSSAHSCPHCGEPLSNEWEEKGRKAAKLRQIGCAVLLLPLLIVVAAAFFNSGPTRSPALQSQQATKTPATPSSQVILQNHAGSGLRVPVFKNTQAHTEALKLMMAGVHKTNPPLVMQLIACMVPSGTMAIITDAGFATHDILVTSGEFAGCRGNIAMEDVQRP
jgi:hypothetical protein